MVSARDKVRFGAHLSPWRPWPNGDQVGVVRASDGLYSLYAYVGDRPVVRLPIRI